MQDSRRRPGRIGAGTLVGAAGDVGAWAPGKRTLTEGLVPAPPSSGGAHRAPPARVAEAPAPAAAPNAALRILVYDAAGAVIQKWESRGRWEGELPQRYTATRRGAGWSWDDPYGASIRVQTGADGRGGKPVEAWAKAGGVTIVVHAQALDAVTLDDAAAASERAPGHARDPQEGGDGATARVAPHGAGDHASAHLGAGPHSDATPGRDARAPAAASETEVAAALGSAATELSVDVFERGLGIGPDADASDDAGQEDGQQDGASASSGAHTGQPPGRGGAAPGDPAGRAGDDTRAGGTGPGGDRARADGQGAGAPDGGHDGTAAGSKDGGPDGAAGGMYGGKGKPGADGVPSGVGLFGGLIGIPAAIKGLVEVALIIADGDITGAGASLYRQGLGKVASAVIARRIIASEARRAAVKETIAAIKAIEADPVRAAAWRAASQAERETATRRIYWELQRRYFDAYQKAARQAKREARAALGRRAGDVAARERLAAAELAEEAVEVKPVAGRLPANHEYAGKAFPNGLLPPQYRSKGLQFTKEGYPDFAPYARELPNGKKYVEIEYTGSRRADFAAANKKAKLIRTPDGWTWHHAEDMKTMYLVPYELHKNVKHSGGAAVYKHGSGVPRYGD